MEGRCGDPCKPYTHAQTCHLVNRLLQSHGAASGADASVVVEVGRVSSGSFTSDMDVTRFHNVVEDLAGCDWGECRPWTIQLSTDWNRDGVIACNESPDADAGTEGVVWRSTIEASREEPGVSLSMGVVTEPSVSVFCGCAGSVTSPTMTDMHECVRISVIKKHAMPGDAGHTKPPAHGLRAGGSAAASKDSCNDGGDGGDKNDGRDGDDGGGRGDGEDDDDRDDGSIEDDDEDDHGDGDSDGDGDGDDDGDGDGDDDGDGGDDGDDDGDTHMTRTPVEHTARHVLTPGTMLCLVKPTTVMFCATKRYIQHTSDGGYIVDAVMRWKRPTFSEAERAVYSSPADRFQLRLLIPSVGVFLSRHAAAPLGGDGDVCAYPPSLGILMNRVCALMPSSPVELRAFHPSGVPEGMAHCEAREAIRVTSARESGRGRRSRAQHPLGVASP